MITSTANPQVKNLQQLARKAKLRNEQDVFLVEGLKLFQEAPRDRILKAYISKSLYEEKGQAFLDGFRYEVLEDRVFEAVSDTKTPQGILCLARQYHYRLEDMVKGQAPFLVLLENLQDPGNLGTIMRTAEGAGADGVILSRNSVDIYNPKTIRSTMGSVYRMPFLYAEDLSAAVSALKKKGVRIYAAHLNGKNGYTQECYQGGTAFLIGNEGSGLSDALAGQADALVRIPMHGKLESLNAAVAAAVLMYEVCRQRQ